MYNAFDTGIVVCSKVLKHTHMFALYIHPQFTIPCCGLEPANHEKHVYYLALPPTIFTCF